MIARSPVLHLGRLTDLSERLWLRDLQREGWCCATRAAYHLGLGLEGIDRRDSFWFCGGSARPHHSAWSHLECVSNVSLELSAFVEQSVARGCRWFWLEYQRAAA